MLMQYINIILSGQAVYLVDKGWSFVVLVSMSIMSFMHDFRLVR